MNDKKCEPFRILQQFHFFYKFDVPSKWYIIDIFHASNLIKAADSKWPPLTEQRNPLLKLAVINNKNQTEWVLNEILNLWYSESDCCFQYKICWSDCDFDSTWYNADDDEFWNMLKALQKYYVWYSHKSDLQFMKSKLICHQLTRAGWREIWNVVSEIVSDSLLFPYWI